MGYYPPGYVHKKCEECKHALGWGAYSNDPEREYRLMYCGREGGSSFIPQPEFGCVYWEELPEVILGFYD